MRNMKMLFSLVLLCIVLPFAAPAQENDSVFIKNYKQFRTFIDHLPTYSLYFVPDSAGSKFLVNNLENEMKEAYHFLRKKKAVKKNPSFNIAVLVDEFVKLPLHKDAAGEQIVQGGIVRAYNLVQPYYLTVTIFVYADGKVLEFPLCIKKEFSKESKYGEVSFSPRPPEKVVTRVVNGVTVTTTEPVYSPPVRNTMDSYATAMNKVNITRQDLTNAFRQVLWSYKNYYVDRVD